MNQLYSDDYDTEHNLQTSFTNYKDQGNIIHREIIKILQARILNKKVDGKFGSSANKRSQINDDPCKTE